MVYIIWCVDGGTRFLNVLSLNFLEDIVVVVVSEMSGKKSYFKIDLLSNIYQSFISLLLIRYLIKNDNNELLMM